MVGVPGRSKGCNTCRKRKIRCSQERPECSQCIKSNRKCLGYERERLFISFNGPQEPQEPIPTREHHYSKEVSSGGSDNSPAGSDSFDFSSEPSISDRTSSPVPTFLKYLSGVESGNRLSPETEHETSLVATHVTSNSLSGISAISAFVEGPSYLSQAQSLYTKSMREQLVGYWYSAYQNEVLAGRPNWLGSVPGFSGRVQVVETSSYAFCLAGMGRRLGDERMIRQSLGLYTKALRELQTALYDPTMMYSDETLAACMLLTMYEVTECPDNGLSGFLNHYHGLAKLVQLRGPQSHITGLGHQVFVHFRSFAAVQSLETKYTFLSDSDWKSIPFKSDQKSRYDRLLDILLEAPPVLRKGESLENMTADEDRLPIALEVFSDCLRLDRLTQEFHAEMDSENKISPKFWLHTDPVKNPDSSEISLVDYEFVDIVTALNMILLWAMQTVLWSCMVKLYILITSLQMSQGLPPTAPGWEKRFTKFIIPARNVLQSASFFMRHEPSARVAVAPLVMVIDALHSWADGKEFKMEIEFGRVMLAGIEKQGMKLIRHLGLYAKSDAKAKEYEMWEQKARLGHHIGV